MFEKLAGYLQAGHVLLLDQLSGPIAGLFLLGTWPTWGEAAVDGQLVRTRTTHGLCDFSTVGEKTLCWSVGASDFHFIPKRG